MQALEVKAPFAGQIVDLKEVPDVVFSTGIVGPGLAINPNCDTSLNATAPLSGQLVKLFPHAFMIQQQDNIVLVHLGIDTVRMAGHGFQPLVTEKQMLKEGDLVTNWRVEKAKQAGYSVICPVVLLEDSAAEIELLVSPGMQVASQQPLYRLH